MNKILIIFLYFISFYFILFYSKDINSQPSIFFFFFFFHQVAKYIWYTYNIQTSLARLHAPGVPLHGGVSPRLQPFPLLLPGLQQLSLSPRVIPTIAFPTLFFVPIQIAPKHIIFHIIKTFIIIKI